MTAPHIGVLALQGSVAEHRAILARLGAATSTVRSAGELDGIDGLVVPGGESTTMSRLAVDLSVLEPVRSLIASGLPAFGTCAGLIMLAERVLDGRPDQLQFGGLDLTVRRNAFGRQAESFELDLAVSGMAAPFPGVFIRAPWVESVGRAVSVLATMADRDGGTRIVAVRQGPVLATAFHPELTDDVRFHDLFLSMVRREQ